MKYGRGKCRGERECVCGASARPAVIMAVPCWAGYPLPSFGARILPAPLLEPAVSSPGRGARPRAALYLAERKNAAPRPEERTEPSVWISLLAL